MADRFESDAEAIFELLNGLGSIAYEAETLAKAVNDRTFPLSEAMIVRLVGRLAAVAAICHESVYQVKSERREEVSG
jgi:hypothetical protein